MVEEADFILREHSGDIISGTPRRDWMKPGNILSAHSGNLGPVVPPKEVSFSFSVSRSLGRRGALRREFRGR